MEVTVFVNALDEFHADWVGAGKALATADLYRSLLCQLAREHETPTVRDVATWIRMTPTRSMARKRAQAVRAFGKWSSQIGDGDFDWWERISVPAEVSRPQATARLRGAYADDVALIFASSQELDLDPLNGCRAPEVEQRIHLPLL